MDAGCMLMPDTIKTLLTQLSQGLSQLSETSSLDAQVLVAHLLGKPRSWVLAHPEVQLDTAEQSNINRAFIRLQSGEPLPYVIGHWEFYGLDFQLTPDVLIPRPETEILVERALAWLRHHPSSTRVIDVGTGSGCIGVALAMNNPSIHVLMTDISPQALHIARQNATQFGLSGRMDFQQADLLDGIVGQFDMICANLPYIPSPMLAQLPVAKREPRLALDGGLSGLDLITRLLDQAKNLLLPGGLLLLEIEASQALSLKSLAADYYQGSNVEILKDLSGNDRCIEVSLSRYIIHLCQPAEWRAAQKRGFFIDDSLETSGFIHCSQPQHVLRVASLILRGTPDLIALWIDPEKIASEIRWESVDAVLYPHIYGPINLPAVIAIAEVKPENDGLFRSLTLPDETQAGR